MDLKLKECSLADLEELRKISLETYYQTFRSMCSEEVMKNYLEEAFNTQKIEQELKNKNSKFYFLYSDNVLSGYLKINEGDAQHAFKFDTHMELERFYVKKDFQGAGLGRHLIKKAIQIAKKKSKECLWLSVWEKNEDAIEFYKKFGFEIIGEHEFRMSHEPQKDYIMALNLAKYRS